MMLRRFHLVLLSAPPLLALAISPAHAQTNPVAASTKPTTPIMVAEHPIPPFTVWQLRPGDSTETQVTQVQLNPSGYWLMAYIDHTSKHSQEFLTQLQTLAQAPLPAQPANAAEAQAMAQNRASVASVAAPPASSTQTRIDPAKLVIVVAHASGAELSALELKYPGLSAAAWTHDSEGAAARQLGIHGAPHLFGMREGQQRWQLAVNFKPQDLEPVLTTWAAFNQLPPNKLTRHKPTPPSTPAPTPPAPSTATTAAPAKAPAQ